MSKRAEKSWSLWCDWLGCEYQFEDGDYSIFGDGYDVEDIVRNSDGWIGGDDTHYCNDHLTIWSSDHEDGDPYPAPPFLLIHDSGRVDDGKASTIAHLHAGLPCIPGTTACPTAAAAKEAEHYDETIEVA